MMNIPTTLIIAVGLALDAFAVSVARGMSLEGNPFHNAFRIALFFGLFQAFMPVLGWSIAFEIRPIVEQVDHWIAFGLLVLVGSKMIFDSVREQSSRRLGSSLGTGLLLILSIATSIDAFAVGISFAFLDSAILVPVITIGVVTFLLSMVGVLAAGKIENKGDKKIGILGGVILIEMGIKVLMEHLQ